jgi:formylglycine-generating enzyme required for sulfatase activity
VNAAAKHLRLVWLVAPLCVFLACNIANRTVEERTAGGGATVTQAPSGGRSGAPTTVISLAGDGALPSSVPDAGTNVAGQSAGGFGGSPESDPSCSSAGMDFVGFGDFSSVDPNCGGSSSGGSTSDSPSCKGLASSCGPNANQNCCASDDVPAGTVYRGLDSLGKRADPATVGHFRLDDYEVTVGRFRKFVAAYSRAMIPAGAGRNPNDPCDPGWDAKDYNPQLDEDAASLASALKCCPPAQTWTDMPGSRAAENLPINCLNWYEANAFCIWDGGRLPNDTEWTYAAAGGDEQRSYPWLGKMVDASFAVYDAPAPAAVGSKSPLGDGKWGQADLAGNVREWTRDWFGLPGNLPYPSVCGTCSVPTVAASAHCRGGSFDSPTTDLLTLAAAPKGRSSHVAGVRCARNAL